MNEATLALIIQLVALAAKLVPVITEQIETVKAQTGKTADEIFEEAGVQWDSNVAKALAILAKLNG